MRFLHSLSCRGLRFQHSPSCKVFSEGGREGGGREGGGREGVITYS